MTPEAVVKKAVKAILAKYKIWYFMPHMSGFGRAGIPDFICCIRGRLLGIETKAKGGKLTRIQEIEHKNIMDAGGVCIILRPDRIQALELLIIIMLRAPIIGMSNEALPVGEGSFTPASNVDEPATSEESAEVARSEQSTEFVAADVATTDKCRHGISVAEPCVECAKGQIFV